MTAITNKLAGLYTDIRLLPDEQLLEKLEIFINTVTNINRSMFSKEQLAEIDDTCAIAELMMQNKDFTNIEFEAFSQKMEAIYALLERNDQTETPNQLNRDVQNQSNSNKEISSPIAKTGDTTNYSLLAMSLLVSGLFILSSKMTIRKRKK